MAARAGRMKLDVRMSIRNRAPQMNPVMAGIWVLAAFHWSTQMTTNRAVMAKSMPVVSNLISSPISAPSTEPRTQ